MSHYEKGFIDGVSAFAWWKNGRQEVGTAGRLLAEVVNNPRACYGFDPPENENDINLGEFTIPDLVRLIQKTRQVIHLQKFLLVSKYGGCSCHLSAPCSFCTEGGNLEIP